MLEESAIWPGHSGKGEGSKQREGERWSGRETAPRKAPRFVDQTVAVHKYHHDGEALHRSSSSIGIGSSCQVRVWHDLSISCS